MSKYPGHCVDGVELDVTPVRMYSCVATNF